MCSLIMHMPPVLPTYSTGNWLNADILLLVINSSWLATYNYRLFQEPKKCVWFKAPDPLFTFKSKCVCHVISTVKQLLYLLRGMKLSYRACVLIVFKWYQGGLFKMKLYTVNYVGSHLTSSQALFTPHNILSYHTDEWPSHSCYHSLAMVINTKYIELC